MLRRSLQNYAKVKAASSQASRGSSEYANCKENFPVVSDGSSMAVPKTASNQPGCDRTPTSRLDQTKAAVLSSQSSKGLPEVVLTVSCTRAYLACVWLCVDETVTRLRVCCAANVC